MTSKIPDEIFIPDITAYEHIYNANKDHLNDIAFDYYGNRFTYKEFFDEIDKYAKSFKKMGVKENDVVTICMLSEPEFMIGYYALNKIGATCNGVSINFLKNNLKKYTDEKDSNILFIYEELFDLIKDKIKETNIKNIILCPIHTYMKEEEKRKYNKGDYLDRLITSTNLPNDKEFIRFKEFRNNTDSLITLDTIKYNKDRINSYLYSSGTTGEPKCVMFTDKTPVSLATMHSYTDMHESRNDKSLIIIPMYYATSLFYCMHLQLTMGKTLSFQPFYNRDTFAQDLIDNEINHTVATISHYMPMLKTNDLSKDAFKKFTHPITGGEAVTFGQKEKVDKFLIEHGSKPLIIGGGTTELGSCAMVDYISKGNMRVTGSFLPSIKWKVIDCDTEEELDYDKRGEYVCDTPAMMKGYYNNSEKTKEYWWYDTDGHRFARPGDIAKKVKIPTEYGYEDGILVEGRKSDSYKDDEGKRIYLFDIENEISKDKDVIECKAVAINYQGNNKCVVHLVIHPSANKKAVIDRISNIKNIEGIKIRDSFDINPNTGKRDIIHLQEELDGFYYKYDRDRLIRVDYSENVSPYKIVDYKELENNFVRKRK